MSALIRSIGVTILVSLAVLGFVAAGSAAPTASAETSAVGAATSADGSAFVVELDEDGDATVTTVITYDLMTAEERAAFEELRSDEAAQERMKQRHADRLSEVAAAASTSTDREMTITDSDIDLTTEGDTGIVRIGVTWTNLAAVDGDRLTVTEPFASGFVAEYPFTIVLPDGYEFETLGPEPDTTESTSATWTLGAPLDSFEMNAERTAASDDDGLPGFGIGMAVIAALVAAAVLGRRPD